MSVQFPQSSQNSSLFEKSSGDVYIVILAQDNDNTKELQFAVRTTLCLKVQPCICERAKHFITSQKCDGPYEQVTF